MSNHNRGLSIDASYQVSVHLAKRFQRRRILKSANQKQESSVAAMFVNGSMNQNLVGSIYGRSSVKNAHFVPIRYQTWLPQMILVSDWLISKIYFPLKPHSQMN
jgi:hypothetical protein